MTDGQEHLSSSVFSEVVSDEFSWQREKKNILHKGLEVKKKTKNKKRGSIRKARQNISILENSPNWNHTSHQKKIFKQAPSMFAFIYL